MHFLFGTVTNSDLKAVRRNVEHPAENQQKLKHVVEESFTLINLNRLKVAENRQTINELIDSLAEVDNRLATLPQRVEKTSIKSNPFYVYFQVDMTTEELKQVMQSMAV